MASSPDLLEGRVEDYMDMYNPLGYMTRMVKPPYFNEELNVWMAVLERLDSCD
jgi:hypothetical protein|tara:strand:+ start:404 stop:562 length:159 start_codon:yes stop_codon:yes gene_type:complete